MLQMKNINKLIPRLQQFYTTTAYFDKTNGLQLVDLPKAKKSLLGNVCLLLPNSFWVVERTFKAAHIVDLIRLANLEKARVSPFPAMVLWKVEQLDSKSMTVKYFCIPQNDAKKLASEFSLLVPIEQAVTDEFVATELLAAASEDAFDIEAHLVEVAKLPLWQTLGFRVESSAVNHQPMISTKKAIIAGGAISLCYVAGLSTYLVAKSTYLETTLESQKEGVNEALLLQQKAQSYQDVLASSKVFFNENPAVAKVIHSIELDKIRYRLTRMEVENNRLSLYGFAFNSTELLKQITESKYVVNAKFGMPVQNHGRFESFIIEGELSGGE